MSEREIQVGDRFLSLDPRSEGRVVEVRELGQRLLVQVEAHPLNPSAVGRHSRVTAATLRRRFTRLSH